MIGSPLPKHQSFQKSQQFQRVEQPSPSNGPSWRNCWAWAILRRSPSALGFRLGFAGAHVPLPLHYRYVTIIRNARSAKN
jgi:hypothetical protein